MEPPLAEDEGSDPSPILIDHAQRPRNHGLMPRFTGHACLKGDCGDVMAIWVGVEGGVVTSAAFLTTGCGTSHACGSMATVLVKGRRLNEAMRLTDREILDALHGLPVEHEHCAVLAAVTVNEACEDALVRLSLRGGTLSPSMPAKV
jgi:nitrogen fixation NifU-like protein